MSWKEEKRVEGRKVLLQNSALGADFHKRLLFSCPSNSSILPHVWMVEKVSRVLGLADARSGFTETRKKTTCTDNLSVCVSYPGQNTDCDPKNGRDVKWIQTERFHHKMLHCLSLTHEFSAAKVLLHQPFGKLWSLQTCQSCLEMFSFKFWFQGRDHFWREKLILLLLLKLKS